ncbi:MAG: hypothetical protein JW944_05465 [Deltaproteobacteria bacterium]|nr:hypothetical protein [Deltaproteobacteria bacterium]
MAAQKPINWGYPGNGADAYGSNDPLYPYGYGLNYLGQVFTAEGGFYTVVSVETLLN